MGQTVVIFGRERRGVGVTVSDDGLFYTLDAYKREAK